MSINQMLLALKAKTGSSARKLVLLKLADNSNDEGVCFPSHQNIADHCEMTKRSVITHISRLEADGFLTKAHRKTQKGNSSNNYFLSISLPSENSAPPSENISPTPSENSAPRNSHSSEPVNEPKEQQAYLENETFVSLSVGDKALFEEYLELRKLIKVKTTPSIINRLLKKYVKYGEKPEIIENAINGNWKDFYEVKESNNGNGQNNHRKNAAETMHDTLKQIAAEADEREMGERVV